MVKPLRSVQKNQADINAIKNLKNRNKAFSIATYNFSDIYANIAHNTLENVMKEPINFCFDGGKKQFISITKFGATWTDNKNKFKLP